MIILRNLGSHTILLSALFHTGSFILLVVVKLLGSACICLLLHLLDLIQAIDVACSDSSINLDSIVLEDQLLPMQVRHILTF